MTRGPGGEHLELLRERLKFDAWRDTNRLDEALLVWRFVPLATGLPGWRAERVRQRQIEGWPPATRSAWRPIDETDDVLLTLDTYECADLVDAHEWLLRLTTGVQSTAFGRLETDVPGDVALGMPNGRSMAFARANLVVFARNGGRTVRSVSEPAMALDRWVVERPEPGGRLAPEFTVAEAAPADAGDGIALRVEARDAADRPVWFKFHAASGGLALANGAPIYRPGAERAAAVTVYAVSEGGVASQSIQMPGRSRR